MVNSGQIHHGFVREVMVGVCGLWVFGDFGFVV